MGAHTTQACTQRAILTSQILHLCGLHRDPVLGADAAALRRAQEEAEFREYAARPNVVDLIQARIAPQIFGAERIKEAVACLLFGGSRKVRPARRRPRKRAVLASL